MFIPLPDEFQNLALPPRFTFPFYYDLHPLAAKAVERLQAQLTTTNYGHDFGIDRKERLGAIGKMFGVLVVQDNSGKIGYLAAFSGKLGNSNDHSGFVPPVFDLLKAQGFFRREEIEINDLTLAIEKLEAAAELRTLTQSLQNLEKYWEEKIAEVLQNNKRAKALRAELRAKYTGDEQGFLELSEELAKQSMHESRLLKEYKKTASFEVDNLKLKIQKAKQEIEEIRLQRAAHSADLQRRIFERYTFLNAKGEAKNVLELFAGSPPAGAGECAAPIGADIISIPWFMPSAHRP